ncbi:MAG TPA: folate-binding protein [Noviherbaspirillum sp.]|jgi:hypothetical protein|uniref:CAF17-like 4Fe-4S cluster assembly/insertion protein YgfZ n=1 Tax=Noviherbaspirillum sp. TaxID=1926288 RepID=UPI002DDD17AB|nr:folate-binding protein [Noviherbaspirillum sp.]HEV2612025.1 folate-binding protein [Noviherbaspirillum sp.]
MNTWLQFLIQHSAVLDEGKDVLGFAGDSPTPSAFVAPLTDLGLIAATGEEAAVFLHNQLTNDVEHLGPSEARLAGYCSPKGRLLASMLMWRAGDGVMLQLPRSIQAAVQKRLQMFVLRAKVKLNDASDTHVALGLAGHDVAGLLMQWFPTPPSAPYAKTESDAGILIRMPDAFSVPRYLWITAPDTAQAAWPTLTAKLPPAGAALWRLSEIHAGIPRITQPTQEQFVPQMVNFELVGGVNFKKGCYPGQEIVARSQYLGKLKRRMMLASVETADARAGMEVFSAADPDQPCGMIVNAEKNDAGGMDCLVEMKIAALDQSGVHLGSANGPVLRFGSLPYALPDAA